MSIGERIKAARSYLGLTLDELSEKTKRSKTTFWNVESGRIRDPGVSIATDVAQAMNINLTWLLTGEGSMFVEKSKPLKAISASQVGADSPALRWLQENPKLEAALAEALDTLQERGLGQEAPQREDRLLRIRSSPQRRIPLYGEKIPAGAPVEIEGFVEDYWSFDDLLQVDAETIDDFRFLEVRGDSMRDAGIWEGDFAVVHLGRQPDNRDMVVARVGQELMLKWLIVSAERVELWPDNPAYKPLLVTEANPMGIIGVVVSILKKVPKKRPGQLPFLQDMQRRRKK